MATFSEASGSSLQAADEPIFSYMDFDHQIELPTVTYTGSASDYVFKVAIIHETESGYATDTL